MRYLVFVDPDPASRAALRRVARQSGQLGVVVAGAEGDAADALVTVEPDIVAVDVDLGAPAVSALLESARRSRPRALRVVVAPPGSSPESDVLSLADRILARPTSHNALLAELAGAGEVPDVDAIAELVGSARGLPSLPERSVELQSHLRRADITTTETARLVEEDTGLSARLLQLANAAVHAPSRPISTVHDAVVYLGLDTVRALTVSSGAFDAYRRAGAPAALVRMVSAHGLACASHAGALVTAERRGDAMTASLMQDIGLLVFAVTEPMRQRERMERATAGRTPLQVIEADELGFTHADVGRALLLRWSIPATVADAVAAHHRRPTDTRSGDLDVPQAVARAHRHVQRHGPDRDPTDFLDDVDTDPPGGNNLQE